MEMKKDFTALTMARFSLSLSENCRHFLDFIDGELALPTLRFDGLLLLGMKTSRAVLLEVPVAGVAGGVAPFSTFVSLAGETSSNQFY